MWSLLKLALLLGTVAALVFLLPLGGRTLADRWQAAGGATDFARRSWAELRGAAGAERAKPPRASRPQGQGQAQAKAGGKPAAPEEGVTEQERQALEKLLGEHLADPPRR